MVKSVSSPVSFSDIEITGGFWKEEQDVFRSVSVDAVYNRFEETGRHEALKQEWKEGMPFKPHIFWESDVTKWIEGAAYFLKKQRNPELEARIDELVERMEKHQDKNGYLNEYFTVVEPDARFTRRTDHELYCAGHLIEGTIAYAEATGKKNLLGVAERYADLIDRVFRIEHSAAFDTPGHEEIELALVKLYRYTGKENYLQLAKYFVDTRGVSKKDKTYDFADMEHMQSHLPVRMQKTAEGHAVRALYLYCGMADVAMETGDEELAKVCRTLFDNIASRRMYVTGGVGSTCLGESFSFDYDLPDYTAYAETCASIALALFCRRMWLMDKDVRYADCAERALYNTVLSGVSLSGDMFFYENPLAVDPRRNAFNDSRPDGLKEHLPILERVKVFGCSCCPPNLVRTVGSIADYMYSMDDGENPVIYAQCYMNGRADIAYSNGTKHIHIDQITKYPYDGRITMTIGDEAEFTLAVRIPDWCHEYSVSVNGEKFVGGQLPQGYMYIARKWQAGDEVVIDLAMPVRTVEANPYVLNDAGRLAIERGPIVYCAEGMDNEDRPLRDVRVSRSGRFTLADAEIAGREVTVVRTEAMARKPFEALYSETPAETENFELTLIPYYCWANRKVTEMNVWFLVRE